MAGLSTALPFMAAVSSIWLTSATLSALTPVTPAAAKMAGVKALATAVSFSAAEKMPPNDWVMLSTKPCKAAWVVMGVALPLVFSSALKTEARLPAVTPLTNKLSSATVGAVSVALSYASTTLTALAMA